jgi:hypothetical protein
MNNTFKNMLEHPFATMMIFTVAAESITRIICAAKGNPVTPVVTMNVSKTEKN